MPVNRRLARFGLRDGQVKGTFLKFIRTIALAVLTLGLLAAEPQAEGKAYKVPQSLLLRADEVIQ